MHGIPRLVKFMIHSLHKLIACTKNKSTYFEVNTASGYSQCKKRENYNKSVNILKINLSFVFLLSREL